MLGKWYCNKLNIEFVPTKATYGIKNPILKKENGNKTNNKNVVNWIEHIYIYFRTLWIENQTKIIIFKRWISKKDWLTRSRRRVFQKLVAFAAGKVLRLHSGKERTRGRKLKKNSTASRVFPVSGRFDRARVMGTDSAGRSQKRFVKGLTPWPIV